MRMRRPTSRVRRPRAVGSGARPKLVRIALAVRALAAVALPESSGAFGLEDPDGPLGLGPRYRVSRGAGLVSSCPLQQEGPA